MSDPVIQPGASVPKDVSPPSGGPVKKDVSLQENVRSLTTRADSLVLRLNKLLASPGGLSAFLSTTNYTLYLLAALQTTFPSPLRLSHHLLHALNYKHTFPPSAPPPTPSTVASLTPTLALAALISKTRTNLRLLGLPSLYTSLRGLLSKHLSPSDDKPLYALALIQTFGYIIFQLLENIYVLLEAGVISKSLADRLSPGGKVNDGKIMLWSCRAWLVGVGADLVRLGREAVVLRERRRVEGAAEGEQGVKRRNEEDAKWWGEVVGPLAWLPVAVHYSVVGGLPGMSMGVVGLCGVVAGLGKTSMLWGATKV